MSKSKTMLGEQLRKLRVAKGHPTARGFASTLGISENRYSRYERGEAVPKLALARVICAELGITPNELYGWQDEASTDDSLQIGGNTVGGFAEGPPSERMGSGRPVGLAPPTADLATWKLATVLSDAMATAKLAPSSELGKVRTTAELFLHLKQDPLTSLARSLQSITAGSLPPDQELALASEVQAFLAALENSGSSINS